VLERLEEVREKKGLSSLALEQKKLRAL